MSYFPNTSVTALQGTNPWAVQLTSGSIATTVNTGNSSVQLVGGTAMVGSVAAYQGAATPWKVELTSGSIATTGGNSSVMLTPGINTIGSVAALQATNPWIVQLTSGSIATTAGETITANAPIIKWVSGVTSVMYGTSVAVLAAQGASVATYVTGIHLINESANTSRVTFTQGTGQAGGSVLLYAIAPATGGTNMQFSNPIRTLDNRQISASINGVSSVYVMLTGFVGNI